MTASEKEPGLRYYLKREPLILALLSAMAVLSFLAVSGLSRIYRAQQQSLGNRWFTRGVQDLKQRRFDRAVKRFGVLTERTLLLMVRSASSRVSNHEAEERILRDAAKRPLLRMRSVPAAFGK